MAELTAMERLMRFTVFSERRATATANMTGCGPMAIDNMARYALERTDLDLAAAIVTVIDQRAVSSRKNIQFDRNKFAAQIMRQHDRSEPDGTTDPGGL